MIIEPLQTSRLRIRPFQTTDWPAVTTYTANPDVMAFMEEGVQTIAQTQDFVAKNAAKPGGNEDAAAYALLLRTDETLIGHMVFHPWFAPRTYEIGWVIHPDHQRLGYATEAATELVRFGFTELNLHRIIATCQPENPPSYQVMEKIGMRREGHFRQCIYRGNDEWWDEYFYAILHKEWWAEHG